MPNILPSLSPNAARLERNKQRQRNYARSANYGHNEWTHEEDSMVLEHSISDRELSEIIHHSVQAIQVRRCRLKKEL